MLEIEHINMAYNETTKFGQFPNGQEAAIEALLNEWDTLKILRHKLKYEQPAVVLNPRALVQVDNDENGRPDFPDPTTRRY